MRTKPRIHGLYAIADTQVLSPGSLVEAVEQAIAGGAKWIQYRDKGIDDNARRTQATTLRQLCQRRGAWFIVNDDADLAVEVGADGVHLGREDCPQAEARARLGAEAVIGVSCYNELDRAVTAEAEGADYVAFGSFYPSHTKPDAVPVTQSLLREAKVVLHLPVVAIGGITPENGAALIKADADALAVIEGVFKQPDIRLAACRYTELFAKKK